MKELIHIFCVPDDNRFVWEVEALLENMIELGFTHEVNCLVFKPIDREIWNENFIALDKKYKQNTNIKFFYYAGNEQIKNDIKDTGYIPLLRIYCLANHFKTYLQLVNNTILYTDSDILFTRKLDFTKFLENDTCYLSDTKGYLGYDYLINKFNDAIEERKATLKDVNILKFLSTNCNVPLDKIKKDEGVGGAQYILKNIDEQFWLDVMNSAKIIRSYLSLINKLFFESEDKGYQSWCADMWGVLWMLWKRDLKTETPEELNFAWATDVCSKLQNVYIYHNAGVDNTTMLLEGKQETLFFKGKIEYTNNLSSPQKERRYLESVSDKYCSSFYSKQLLKVNNPVF